MIKFKIDGKTILSPHKWEELSLQQIIDIELCEKDNLIKLFSIITGVPVEIAEQDTTPKLELTLNTIVAFVFIAPEWDKMETPTHLKYKGELFPLPKKFETLFLGQKTILQQEVFKEIEDIKKVPEIVAVSMQPTINSIEKKKTVKFRVLNYLSKLFLKRGLKQNRKLIYIPDKKDKIVKQLLKENGVHVYQVYRFFFMLSKNLYYTGSRNSTEYPHLQTHKPQLYKSLQKLNALIDSKIWV